MGESEIFDIINQKKFFKIIKNNKQLSGVENNFIFNFLLVKLFLENER